MKPKSKSFEMVQKGRQRRLMANLVFSILLLFQCHKAISFAIWPPLTPMIQQKNVHNDFFLSSGRKSKSNTIIPMHSRTTTQLFAMSDDEERELKKVQEEARVKILTDRRKTIRGVLKAAEKQKNFRLNNGYVPEVDENGKPIKSDAQSAVTITAFVVAAGAVALRIGGRAALVSALGLDFATENPELRDGLSSVLDYASSIGPETELGLFILAWTGVKVFCFDAGGVVLALASGILFGGVWQGAVVSAFAATVGSSIAFSLAKLDTPVRKKALEVVEEYPSLRGIEKVVAKDGLKAILTLRLAPVLPIPIGLYNYVYGVTNVPFFDFAGGIFLGSLKPYLLDSYLGVFGKQLVDGTANDSGIEDFILLVALGVSVLIGVFASQLANETWESINEEIELEKAAAREGEEKDDVVREFMGMSLPQWIVGFQLSLQAANERVNDMILQEYVAGVWNSTEAELSASGKDPALLPTSPEIVGADKGFDFAASICDGLVLSPALFAAYLKYADPLYDDTAELEKAAKLSTPNIVEESRTTSLNSESNIIIPEDAKAFIESLDKSSQTSYVVEAEELISVLSKLRSILNEKLDKT